LISRSLVSSRSSAFRAHALANAYRFEPFVADAAPFFVEEIRGVAAGAGISIEEAWLLQLRAELGVVPAEALVKEPGDECTSYAVLPEATADGNALIGQNADLPGFYGRLGVIVELVFDDMPKVLMLTPAGQVSYLGINDAGMGAFANYLTCDGWRVGFPRYLLSRLALSRTSVVDALAAIRALHRASSRNLMLMDGHGIAVDLETTPTSDAEIHPVDGILAHANHYDSPELQSEERANPEYLPNTRTRGATMWRLLNENRGRLNADLMETILRDRSSYPDCLCRVDADNPQHDSMTFASLIAQPGIGSMRVAVGPPHEHEYIVHTFTA
jgi:isopenicillin-N N-acyltransferase-like protein